MAATTEAASRTNAHSMERVVTRISCLSKNQALPQVATAHTTFQMPSRRYFVPNASYRARSIDGFGRFSCLDHAADNCWAQTSALESSSIEKIKSSGDLNMNIKSSLNIHDMVAVESGFDDPSLNDDFVIVTAKIRK